MPVWVLIRLGSAQEFSREVRLCAARFHVLWFSSAWPRWLSRVVLLSGAAWDSELSYTQLLFFAMRNCRMSQVVGLFVGMASQANLWKLPGSNFGFSLGYSGLGGKLGHPRCGGSSSISLGFILFRRGSLLGTFKPSSVYPLPSPFKPVSYAV